MNVRTKLVDGYLMAQVNIDGYPDYLSDPRLALLNKDSRIFLIFNDKDGFSVEEKELLVHTFTKITDSLGKNVGLTVEFKDYWSTCHGALTTAKPALREELVPAQSSTSTSGT